VDAQTDRFYQQPHEQLAQVLERSPFQLDSIRPTAIPFCAALALATGTSCQTSSLEAGLPPLDLPFPGCQCAFPAAVIAALDPAILVATGCNPDAAAFSRGSIVHG